MKENTCLSEILAGQCCCKCVSKDEDGKTCCNGTYVAKEHGYCQMFTNYIKWEENK
jgi:hypothetical protein